jgi:hypothetical protein
MSPIETRSEKQNTTRNTRDSQTPKTEYKDSVFDLLFINGCRQAFGRVAGWQVSQSAGKVSVLCFFPLDISVGVSAHYSNSYIFFSHAVTKKLE